MRNTLPASMPSQLLDRDAALSDSLSLLTPLKEKEVLSYMTQIEKDVGDAVRKINGRGSIRWQPVRKMNGVAVSRSSATKNDDAKSSFTNVRSACTVNATFEEMMDFLITETTEDFRRMERQIRGDEFIDGAVLHVLYPRNDQRRFVCIKWQRLKNFALESRDYAYVEIVDSYTDPRTNQRIGFRLAKSLQIYVDTGSTEICPLLKDFMKCVRHHHHHHHQERFVWAQMYHMDHFSSNSVNIINSNSNSNNNNNNNNNNHNPPSDSGTMSRHSSPNFNHLLQNYWNNIYDDALRRPFVGASGATNHMRGLLELKSMDLGVHRDGPILPTAVLTAILHRITHAAAMRSACISEYLQIVHLQTISWKSPDLLIPISKRSFCVVCTKSFSLVRKKYNCLACGDVICGQCSFQVQIHKNPAQESIFMRALRSFQSESSLDAILRPSTSSASSSSSKNSTRNPPQNASVSRAQARLCFQCDAHARKNYMEQRSTSSKAPAAMKTMPPPTTKKPLQQLQPPHERLYHSQDAWRNLPAPSRSLSFSVQSRQPPPPPQMMPPRNDLSARTTLSTSSTSSLIDLSLDIALEKEHSSSVEPLHLLEMKVHHSHPPVTVTMTTKESNRNADIELDDLNQYQLNLKPMSSVRGALDETLSDDEDESGENEGADHDHDYGGQRMSELDVDAYEDEDEGHDDDDDLDGLERRQQRRHWAIEYHYHHEHANRIDENDDTLVAEEEANTGQLASRANNDTIVHLDPPLAGSHHHHHRDHCQDAVTATEAEEEEKAVSSSSSSSSEMIQVDHEPLSTGNHTYLMETNQAGTNTQPPSPSYQQTAEDASFAPFLKSDSLKVEEIQNEPNLTENGWKSVQSRASGKMYYYNESCGRTSWTLPEDDDEDVHSEVHYAVL